MASLGPRSYSVLGGGPELYIITYWPVVLGIGLVIYVNHRQR